MEPGWIPWSLPRGSGRSNHWNFGETFLKYIAFGAPNPNYDWTTFNFDTDIDRTAATRALSDAVDPDLTRFKSRGGKIVMYFGWADPALNPLRGISYFEEVRDRFGVSTAEFFRLYMVPGMFHCGGGVGVNTFDALTPLVAWIERGVAPNSIPGSRVIDGKVVRTRPLCPYPQTAVYKGSGGVDDTANFACKVPAPSAIAAR